MAFESSSTPDLLCYNIAYRKAFVHDIRSLYEEKNISYKTGDIDA